MKTLAQDLRLASVTPRDRGWLRQDIEQIAALSVRLGKEYDGEDDSDYDWNAKLPLIKTRLGRSFNNPWHYYHVIRVAEKIVAIAGLAPSRLSGLDGLLHSVYVEPEFRGYGFGRRVTRGVMDYARSVGMKSLEMPESTNPVAVALYRSLGFQSYLLEGVPHMAIEVQ